VAPVAGPAIDDHHPTMDRDVAGLVARLVLDPDADRVVGTLTGDDGTERRFSGWMQLASAIEAWRTAHGRDAGGDTTRDTPTRPVP
jgi:hypothetical protein